MSDGIEVLIIDDQPHLALALEHLLRSVSEVDVTTIADGAEGLHLAIHQPPELVILATTIGPIDAWTAARMIRDQWQNHAGHIWLSAGRLEPLDADIVTAAGVDHVLTHPYDPNAVIDRIRALTQPR